MILLCELAASVGPNVLIATLRENSFILAGPQAEMDYVCLYYLS